MNKAIKSIMAVWILTSAGLTGLLLIIPEEGMKVSAATITVDDSGGADYFTIQAGINAASPGDTVFVFNGTYKENVIINKMINLTGEDRDTTTIEHGLFGGDDTILATSDWVNVTGFTLIDSIGFDSAAVRLDNVKNCHIYNNIVSDNSYGIYLSSSSSTTIANNTVSDNWDGIYLSSSSSNTIANNTASGNSVSGIYLDDSDSNTITNNDASTFFFDHGIWLRFSSSNTITNNTVSNNWIGIYLSSSSSNTIANNTASGNQNGIYLGDSNSNTIANNTASNNYVGISLFGSSSNIIVNNTASNNDAGIYLEESITNTIANNTMIDDGIFIVGDMLEHWNTHIIDTTNTVNGKPVYYWKDRSGGTVPSGAGEVILANCDNIVVGNQDVSNGSVGIELGFSDSNTIANNTASNNWEGIYLIESNDNTIANNTAASNNDCGIFLGSSDRNTIDNNTASNNVYSGIYLYQSSSNTITNNTASWNDAAGIALEYSDDNTIANNTASTNAWGIYLGVSSSNIIVNNTASSNNDCGTHLDESYDNTIANNNVSSNNDDSIYLYSSSSNTIANNTASNNGDGINIDCSDGNTIVNNTASSNNDDGIYLYFSSSNTIVNNTASNNANGIFLWWYSDDNTIANNNASNNANSGIHLDESYDNTIANNTASNNGDGIYVSSSSSNTVANNTASNNGDGISLRNSDSNTIANNTASNNDYGLSLWSSSDSNTIANNNALNNVYSGIYLNQSNSNTIANNTVSSNGEGINLSSSSSNKIYHNYIIGNTNQAFDDINNSDQWDNGYPSGGNYWSDYGGFDDYGGPNQDQPGSDSIGDINYSIDSNSQDNYPLMGFIDELGPRIYLISPAYNSVIQPGVILDLNVYDEDLDLVNYSIDGGMEQSFSPPFNISTAGWDDGLHSVCVNATDLSNHSVSKTFLFTIDSIKPIIQLNSPNNNSIIPDGTFLNFSVLDSNLGQVNYTVNGGSNISLSDPFNISTSDWPGGNYTVQINALDQAGNLNLSWFNFTINPMKPSIHLNSPLNNSVILGGTFLNFSVTDSNLDGVNYSINGDSDVNLSDPFNISTSGWPDGDYTVQINAVDMVGNSNSSWFFLTIDSIKPLIQLNSPGNNSVISSGILLDFSITDPHPGQVNYSINGGSDISLPNPFDISTSGWPDGDYTVQINAVDMAGNSNSSWYLFTIDSTSPTIILNAPENNSMIPSGTLLNFSIIDINLIHANYSIDGNNNITFSDPFDIDTDGWPDGNYIVRINAEDTEGNYNTSWYIFIIESAPPIIDLISPLNNSIIQPQTLLDFSIIDSNLMQVNYSVNSEADDPLPDPFDISTAGWADGDYTVQISAIDLAGNSISSWFLFTIDSTPPTINLEAPANNSIIPSGTSLYFSITDPNLNQVNYSIDGGASVPISDPYNIWTSGWADGDSTVHIYALDLAGNSNSSWFFFTIDSTPPTISIDPLLNHSTIPVGYIIEINISAEDLDHASFSINEREYVGLELPFVIDTSGWEDGSYTITIKASDAIGNEAEIWFEIKVDATLPYVITANPSHESTQFDIDGSITITFSEEMNQTDIESYLSIFPDTNFTYQWHSEDTLDISFDTSNLALGTTYYLTIDEAIMDFHGNSMGSDFLLTFTTRFLDSDNDGTPDIEDEDDDNDGYPDDEDDFPLDNSEWQDFDGDGVGDNADLDDDDDGHPDSEDVFPYDPDRWREKEEPQSSNILPILALVVAVIVVMLLLYLFVLRKRGGESEEIEWEETPGTEDQEPEEEEVSFEAMEPSNEPKEVNSEEEDVSFEVFKEEQEPEKQEQEEVTFEEMGEE